MLCALWLIFNPDHYVAFVLLVLLALMFGLCLVMPIGGADMPTVISLLNSYAGLSASMMGFVLDNYLLIIAGALDGSSGLILSILIINYNDGLPVPDLLQERVLGEEGYGGEGR